tara:strand:+ start:68 stop:466 length:399 start_codon:yes stop_codon:yes gene_type:complete
MALLNWEQISNNLPDNGENLTGSLNLSGSFDVAGTILINNVDITALISSGSGIFQPTGSFYSTTNNLEVTGSFLIDLDGIEDTFTVSTSGNKSIEINTEGTLQIVATGSEPTAVPGGIYFSTDNNFYFGFVN